MWRERDEKRKERMVEVFFGELVWRNAQLIKY